MSSATTVERTEEAEQITEETMLTRLEAKFGKALMADNFTVIPNRVIDKFRDLGITPTEFTFWVTILRCQYGESPAWPSIDRISEAMGKHERTIKRYIKRMEDKGMLTVIRGEPNQYGKTTNKYDFTPMYDKIVALYPYTETNLLTNNKNGKGENEPGKPDHKRGGDKLSPHNGTNGNTKLGGNTTKMTAELSKKSAEMPPKEDEYEEEESSRRKRDSNLRSADAQNLKGTVLNERSNHSPQQSGKETSTPNQPTNNQKPNKRKTKNESVAPDSQEQATPPAWSNVPTNNQPGSDANAPVPMLPTYSSNYLDDLSRQYRDMAPASSQTRAAKIFAQLARWGVDDDAFVKFLHLARKQTSQANITRQNPDGTINSMPYFFKVLEDLAKHNMGLWAEEDRRRAEEKAGQSNEGS